MTFSSRLNEMTVGGLMESAPGKSKLNCLMNIAGLNVDKSLSSKRILS